MLSGSLRLESARELARGLALEPTHEAVYISGSLVAGLGSSTSDVDVFVVLAVGTAKPKQSVQLQTEHSRVDIEFIEWDYLESSVDRVLSVRLSRGSVRDVWIPQGQLDDVVRLSFADVIKSTPRLEKLIRTLDENHNRLRNFLVARWSVEATNFYEDLIGAAQDKNWGFAVYVGQDFVSSCGKALAASMDDLYFGKKWIYDQLFRSALDGFPLDIFQYFQTGSWANTMQPNISDLVTFSQSMLGRACAAVFVPQVLEVDWYESVPLVEGPIRSSNFLPIPIEDGVLLNHEGTRQMLLKPHAAAVWALSDGESKDRLYSNLRLLVNSPEGEVVLDKIVERLHNSGALTI